jgi:hypothetical protein
VPRVRLRDHAIELVTNVDAFEVRISLNPDSNGPSRNIENSSEHLDRSSTDSRLIQVEASVVSKFVGGKSMTD